MKSFQWILLFLLFLIPNYGYSQAGTIDRNFGSTIESSIAVIPNELAIKNGQIGELSNGKIIVSYVDLDYNIYLSRFKQDGSIDYSFGSGGTLSLTQAKAYRTKIRILNHDQILILAYEIAYPHGTFHLIQMDADGNLDPFFGDSGIVSIKDIHHEVVTQMDLIIDNNESILIRGFNQQNYIIRLLRDGQRDLTFGEDGVFQITATGSAKLPFTMTADRKGNILVSGHDSNIPQQWICKIKSSGVLDENFAEKGYLFFEEEHVSTIGIEIAVTNENNYLISYLKFSNGDEYRIKQYSEEGVIDTSFGDSGTVCIESKLEGNNTQNLALDSENRILLKEYTSRTKVTKLHRFLSNGDKDDSFGAFRVVGRVSETVLFRIAID